MFEEICGLEISHTIKVIHHTILSCANSVVILVVPNVREAIVRTEMSTL